MTKINLAIICGGISGEHEVSLQSAKSVLLAIDRNRFSPVLIGVDKMGVWRKYTEENWLVNADNPKTIALSSFGKQLNINPFPGTLKSIGIDAVFPLIHGTYGEDGTLQGLLELVQVPYVGPDVAGSSIAIDKDLTKKMLSQAGIQTVPSITLIKNQDNWNIEKIWNFINGTCFVKPARCGSSIGISKVTQKEDLLKAIHEAFKHDDKVLIEKSIIGREIECAVLDGNPKVASVLGEIIPPDSFYSYEAKYIDENATQLIAPAPLDEVLSKTIRDTALKAFDTIGLEGMSRVDFFVTNDDNIYINEINTIPGFTKISMYPKLLELTGVPYQELITKLVNLGIERYQRRNSKS